MAFSLGCSPKDGTDLQLSGGLVRGPCDTVFFYGDLIDGSGWAKNYYLRVI